jgi:hypothetical protein
MIHAPHTLWGGEAETASVGGAGGGQGTEYASEYSRSTRRWGYGGVGVPGAAGETGA